MKSASMNSRSTHVSAPREWTAEVAGEVLNSGDRVMHPAHGVGRVERIATQDVSGFSLEFIHVASGFSLEFIHVVFDETRMTLRVPSNKARTIGLRRIASRTLIQEALAVLRAVQRSGMRRRLRRRSRPPMAARKRSWASELRRLDLRMLKAKLRSLAKTPGLMRICERSSPMVTSRL